MQIVPFSSHMWTIALTLPWTLPYLAVEHPHVLDVDVADEALLAGVLANRPHGLAVCAIAVHGVNVQISSVGLRREAVVADVDPGPLDADVLHVQGVEEIGVLRQRGGIVRLGRADDVLVGNVLGCVTGTLVLVTSTADA